MALYLKWDVKNGFAYVLQFFSFISNGVGGVAKTHSMCSSLEIDIFEQVKIAKVGCSIQNYQNIPYLVLLNNKTQYHMIHS